MKITIDQMYAFFEDIILKEKDENLQEIELNRIADSAVEVKLQNKRRFVISKEGKTIEHEIKHKETTYRLNNPNQSK